MTRVILSLDVLEYRQAMAELVNEVCDETKIIRVDPESEREQFFVSPGEPSVFRLNGLLKPPRIEALDPYLFPPEVRVDGIIQIVTSGDYGVVSVYVALEDDRGKEIESGFALKDETEAAEWYYFPSASPLSGTSVTVRAIVMDKLGGVGIQQASIIV